MNLAIRDVRRDLGRFLLTAFGLGLLLATVLGMTGIYNGMVIDALALPRALGADLWVVQRDTRGPFAEVSRVAPELEDRLRAVPGAERTRQFAYHTVQRVGAGGAKLRFAVVGLAWPDDRGDGLPLVAGRALRQSHFEMIADGSLGLALGERIRLGRDDYRVVGITAGLVSSGGDPVTFLSAADARRVQWESANESLRLEREARRVRVVESELGRDPELVRRAAASSQAIPALGPPPVAAVLVDVAPGADAGDVRASIEAWPDVSVFGEAEQEELLTRGVIERSRQQIGLFRAILVVISTILMGLILYTMTLDKLHSIALLKLLGAQQRVILALILQEALLLGAIAYAVALAVGALTFEHFPRRVVVEDRHRLALLGVVAAISLVASVIGVRRALATDPNQVLAS